MAVGWLATPDAGAKHHRCRDDIALMAALGVDAYRFSTAWSAASGTATCSATTRAQTGVDKGVARRFFIVAGITLLMAAWHALHG